MPQQVVSTLHQEISTQIILILKSHPGMMTRPQHQTPHIVSPTCPLKINTTTIYANYLKTEKITTTK
jgi:hypothetical protein